jgi:putative transposase
MTAATTSMPTTGVVAILAALGLSVATFYRRRQPKVQKQPKPTPARALSHEERQNVLALLHDVRFVDKAPAEILATLLEEGQYPCSERTMYRILAAHGEVKERRDQLRHPAYTKPELIAQAPNEVWSWDITKLKTWVKFEYLYLYVILDIYSRYVVGWLLAENESATLAERLVKETCEKHGSTPAHLHADRGSPMKSKLLSQLLVELDIGRSHSRPHVSNDNPFSESQFKTLKYHPTFPDKFGGLEHGLTFCRSFFPWYNAEHHHSGLAYLTPRQVHYGQADEVLRQRYEVLMTAYREHPERFVGGPPRVPSLARAVYINPPSAQAIEPGGDQFRVSTKPTTVASGSDAFETDKRNINAQALVVAGGAAGDHPNRIVLANQPFPPCPSALPCMQAQLVIEATPPKGGPAH